MVLVCVSGVVVTHNYQSNMLSVYFAIIIFVGKIFGHQSKKRGTLKELNKNMRFPVAAGVFAFACTP